VKPIRQRATPSQLERARLRTNRAGALLNPPRQVTYDRHPEDPTMPNFRVRIGNREYLVEADGALHAMQIASVQFMLAKLVKLLPKDIQVDDWDELHMEYALRDPAPISNSFKL
jgi:hypothetical protein